MTSPVRIRPAGEADVPAIHAIETASFGDPWSERSFRSMLGIERVRAMVAERDGAVVGYCIAWLLGEEAELANIAVAPGALRGGVGAALLDDLLTALDPEDVTVYLEVRDSNASAQALYRSRGFTASGRRNGYYARPTEDAIVMRRTTDGR